MRFPHLLTLFIFLFYGNINAQRTCAAEDIFHQHLSDSPAFRSRVEEIERHTQEYIQSLGGAQERIVVTIPVVVNVVWNSTVENISDDQIYSQIAILNQDFRRLNADAVNTPVAFQSIAADCEINFVMAARDPQGNATNGIRRQQTNVTGFEPNDAVKYAAAGGLDAWPRDQYLNIWVCNLTSGLLGYAQFPGGPAATDGVVIDYQYFGNSGTALFPFNKGRTATHEVGHWLNLRHIWGDDGISCVGSDLVTDTPNQADENYGCPSFPAISCSNGPNGDMFMNYMDYTDDACMNAFTAGQKARMQALFAPNGPRFPLLSSPGALPPVTGTICAAPIGMNATNVSQTSAIANWTPVSGTMGYVLQYKTLNATNWTTVTGLIGTAHLLNGLTAGTSYQYRVQSLCDSILSVHSAIVNFTTLAEPVVCSDEYESNNSLNTAKPIPTGTTIVARIGSFGDRDYYQFSNNPETRNIKIDLTNLPKDYDLRLYRGNMLVASSLKPGLTNEVIRFNTTVVSSQYRAYVFGYNNAWSATECYNLTVSLSATPWRTEETSEGSETRLEVPVTFVSQGFGMFPNPANSKLTIEVEQESDSDAQIVLMDASGRVVLEENVLFVRGTNQHSIDLESLSNGVYLVRLLNGESASTRKLIIQK